MSDAPRKILSDFLSTHYQHIDSIAWSIRSKYNFNNDGNFFEILSYLKKEDSYFHKIKSDSVGDKEQALVNLRNSWYNESAFLDKSKYGVETAKFIPWNVVTFYYSIFTALSSIVRCDNNNSSLKGHKRMINHFTNHYLTKKCLCKDMFIPPFCIIKQKNGKFQPQFEEMIALNKHIEYHKPRLKKCMNSLQQNKNVSLFHYFLDLRTWVNYEDSYIFRRLYGESVRPKFYRNMYWILSSFLSITEAYLIWVFGYEKINEEKRLYISEFDKYFESEVVPMERVTYNLKKRFEYYDNFKLNKLA